MTRVVKGVVAVPSQGPAHPQQLQDWPEYLQQLPSTTSFHQLPARRPSSTLTVCDGVSGWPTIPGQWPWQTAAYVLLLAPFIPNL